MADLVPASDIERIVGASRHRQAHLGRAVSAEQRVYILHSQRCLDSGIDLRECPYSKALDRGIHRDQWDGFEDQAVLLAVWRESLRPLFRVTPDGRRDQAAGVSP